MLGSLTFASAAAHGAGLGLHEWSLVWSSAIVIGIVLTTALVARTQAGLVPKGLVAIYEHIFDWLESIAFSFMGKEGRNYVPLATSFFLYILISNWMGLIPWPVWHDKATHQEYSIFESPTISISTTLALAVLAVLAFNLLGLRKFIFPERGHYHLDKEGHVQIHHHGDHAQEHDHHSGGPSGFGGLMAWIARLWEPVPMIFRDLVGPLKIMAFPLFFLFLLLNIVDRFLPLVSLSLRLYGNISAKHTVKASLVDIMEQLIHQGDLFSWVLTLVLFGATCFVAVLGALAGFLQAMIFSVLLLSYIGHAIHTDDH